MSRPTTYTSKLPTGNPLWPLLFIVLVPAIVIGIVMLLSWPVMLLLGAASITSDGIVPALGYEPTVFLTGIALLVRPVVYNRS